jgi:hypothetical protein
MQRRRPATDQGHAGKLLRTVREFVLAERARRLIGECSTGRQSLLPAHAVIVPSGKGAEAPVLSGASIERDAHRRSIRSTVPHGGQTTARLL